MTDADPWERWVWLVHAGMDAGSPVVSAWSGLSVPLLPAVSRG